jgi:hypothetical protein
MEEIHYHITQLSHVEVEVAGPGPSVEMQLQQIVAMAVLDYKVLFQVQQRTMQEVEVEAVNQRLWVLVVTAAAVTAVQIMVLLIPAVAEEAQPVMMLEEQAVPAS